MNDKPKFKEDSLIAAYQLGVLNGMDRAIALIEKAIKEERNPPTKKEETNESVEN